MTAQQPEALRLVDLIDANLAGAGDAEISAELRRLYAENEKLRAENSKLQKWIVGEAQVAGTLDRKLRKARKQRDELLEALKRIAMACSASARNVGWAAQHARAAIAKAGGAV